MKSKFDKMHTDAMQLAELADWHRNYPDVARLLHLAAAKLELMVAQESNGEPSKSIFYRSAASCAFCANEHDFADHIIDNAFRDCKLPLDIEDELLEIRTQIAVVEDLKSAVDLSREEDKR